MKLGSVFFPVQKLKRAFNYNLKVIKDVPKKKKKRSASEELKDAKNFETMRTSINVMGRHTQFLEMAP